MTQVKQIDWAKFGYQQPAPNVKIYKINARNGKVKTFNARPKKRTKANPCCFCTIRVKIYSQS